MAADRPWPFRSLCDRASWTYHRAVIVRHMPGGRMLVDREALAAQTGLTDVTIRARLRDVGVVEYDKATGRALYDHDAASAALAGAVPRTDLRVPRRPRRKNVRESTCD